MTDKDIEKTDDVSILQAHGEADLAGEFLAKALKHSFIILKAIMMILVVLFITSGIFKVEPDENAIVLRFGKIQEFRSPETGEYVRVLGPGLHWNWPEPVTEIIKIPVAKKQTVAIDSFWYFETPAEKLGTVKGRPGATLDPRKDGYCLTRGEGIASQAGGDYGIVHGKWQLTYRIKNIEKFYANIYYETPGPGKDFLDVASKTVDPLLKAIASDAIVRTMAKYTIDQAIVSEDSIKNNIKRLIEERLRRLDSGIVVDEFSTGKITWPRQVAAAFDDPTLASQKKNQDITDAKSYADKILSAAGGAQAAEILDALKQPDLSEQDSRRYLSQLSGAGRDIIAKAHAYRTTVVEAAKANADYFKKLLPEYRQRPKLVVQRIYQDAIEHIFVNATEKIIVQSSAGGKGKQMRILINPDPAKRRRQMEEKKKQEENNK
ncbi:MAG: hypothetical protein DRP66_06595 [Planctomycetota bacterium]|nr:MAG: hypothetical protein DRP66_06595 [Planctomycetota bacterium]